jgi:curved DNA-binding protein
VAYKDYYRVLGVERTAPDAEIKRAYRKLARQYHPDVSREADAEQRFKDVNEAHEVLKDAQKRALYDRYGEAWKAAAEGHAPPPGSEHVREDFGATGFNSGDFADVGSVFEAFFGGPFRAGRSGWGESGADREATIELDLGSALKGGEHSLELLDPGSSEQKQYTVRIPPGVRPGQRIRLAGQGARGTRGAGDLYLHVQLKPSASFRLEGSDVYTSLSVAPWEAALGATVPLRTLDGSVRVKVPPGSSSGRKIRLKGKGYPAADGGRGDLYAEVRIEVPPELSPEERQLLERWAEITSFRARTEDAA